MSQVLQYIKSQLCNRQLTNSAAIVLSENTSTKGKWVCLFQYMNPAYDMNFQIAMHLWTTQWNHPLHIYLHQQTWPPFPGSCELILHINRIPNTCLTAWYQNILHRSLYDDRGQLFSCLRLMALLKTLQQSSKMCIDVSFWSRLSWNCQSPTQMSPNFSFEPFPWCTNICHLH